MFKKSGSARVLDAWCLPVGSGAPEMRMSFLAFLACRHKRIKVVRLHNVSFLGKSYVFLAPGKTGPSVDGNEIQVTETDFQKALEALVPSVSFHELKRYKDIQRHFTLANNGTAKK